MTVTSYGRTYIYDMSPRDGYCDGNVWSVQICYWIKSHQFDAATNLFTFLVLKKSNLKFTVRNSILLKANPRSNSCTNQRNFAENICCEVITLDEQNMFNLTSTENFSFGINVNGNTNARPLLFTGVREYLADQYQINRLRIQDQMFTLKERNRKKSKPLLLLRLLVSKNN